MNISALIQTAIDGILIGSVYATIAVGLSLAFGLMRMVNFAQGEFLMVALYLAFGLVMSLGMDPYLTILVTAPVMFLVGFFMQKFLLNRLLAKDTAREPNSILLFTAGLGMFFSNMVTFLFSSNTKYTTTKYTSTSFFIGDIVVSKPKLISGVIAIAVTLILYYVIQKTEFGRALRATSQNRNVAQLMGIDYRLIYSLVFGISTALVGLSASLLVPNITIFPTIGANYSVRCFILVVLGGRGSIIGCLLGGLLVGLVEKFGTLFWTDSYAQMMVFLIFLLVLIFRPQGLMGKES